MNGQTFEKEINRKKLVPNLKSKTLIVIDNVSCHSVQSVECPPLAQGKRIFHIG